MKANELRIGNIIRNSPDDGKVVLAIEMDVHSLQYYVVFEDGTFCPIESIEPIPITTEWLLNLGGIDTQYEITIKCKRKRIVFEWSSRVVHNNDRFGWRSTKFTHIKSVHQLQNLYFALTNEELTIKQ
jgi:hypothetical protein